MTLQRLATVMRFSPRFVRGWIPVLAILILTASLIYSNTGLWSGVYVTQDYAATSIGAYDARHFSQLYGTPSWNNYNHPGPAWMYFIAPFDAALGLFGVNPSGAIAAFLAKIALSVIALVVVAWVLHRFYRGAATDIAVLFLLGWLILKPGMLESVWEPHVGAVVFILFLALLSLATEKAVRDERNLPLIFLSGLLAALLVQIQLSFAFAALLLSLIFIGWTRDWRSWLGYSAGAALGLAPVVADLVLAGAANLKDYLNYSQAAALSSRLSLSKAFSILGESLVPGAVAFCILLALLLSVICLPKGRPNKVAQGTKGSIPTLEAYSIASIAAALLFYLFAARNTYAPPHSSVYSYVAAGIFFSAVLARLVASSEWADKYYLGRIGAFILFLVALYLGIAPVPIGGIGYLKSSEMGLALDEAAQAAPEMLGIQVAFAEPDANVSSSVRELPWSVAVGFANELRRRNLSYCYLRSDHGAIEKYGDRIMTRFMKTVSCSDQMSVRSFSFKCDGGKLVVETRTKAFALMDCR